MAETKRAETKGAEKPFDVVILGATGFTGRQAVRAMRRQGTGLRWAIAGRNVAAMQAGVATGIQFNEVSYPALADAIGRTVALHAQPKAWRQLQRNAMACDFSWESSGNAYADLYASLLA